MTKLAYNPFIYGKPVPTGRFIGRQSEVRTVFSRLYGGESTAIVGEPHIGKTSLLHYIVDEDTRREWIAQVFAHTAFADFDCHLIGADYTPQDFWRQVLLRAAEQIEDESVRGQCQTVAEKGANAFELESLFRLIGKREYRVALMLDEFDTLLNHPRFGQPEFLAALRSLATRTDGLALITASRLSVAQMNRNSQYHSPSGSPFFNNMIEVRLPHLSHDEAHSLLVGTLTAIGDGVVFEPGDLELAYALAGRHPFLLQIAGASLFDAIAEGASSLRPELRARAAQLFQQRAAAHFDDYWRTLDEPHQRTMLALALAEQARQVRQGAFDWQQFASLPWFEGDLRRLTDLGAVEWQAGNAMLAVGGLRFWLIENVIAGNRYAADFTAWLQAKGNQNLLTAHEMKALQQISDQLLMAGQDETRSLGQINEPAAHQSGTAWEPDPTSRSAENARPPQSPQKPIIILFLAADPSSSTRLSLDEEVRAIDQSLRQANYRDQFDLRQHWAVRVADLQELLLRHQPHIVHFSGHGSQAGQLLMEDDSGRAFAVPPDALSRLFAILRDNLHCVVLNACYSEQQAEAIAATVDCVIGMPDVVGDAASLNFSASFYQALAYGRDVQTAFDLGCNLIELHALDEDSQPRLLALRRNPGEVVFVAASPVN